MSVNILITGHKGYIGSALMRVLSQTAHINKVVGYDIVDGDDILDYNRLRDVMIVNKPDIVIHLAAISSISSCNSNPKQAFMTNGKGTKNVLDAMKEAGCDHIIYASTSSVYGNNYNTLTETTPLNPFSVYGLSKLVGEHAICNHFDYKQNHGGYLIYRMFNVAGTSGFSDIDSKVTGGYDRLFGALESGNITIYGDDYPTFDGTCERDYISLIDVCNAYIRGINLLACKFNVREVVNICSGHSISVNSVIDIWNQVSSRISDNSDRYHKYSLLPIIKKKYGPRRQGDPARVRGSNKKSYKVLEWKPSKKMEDIILDLAFDKKL